MSWIIGVLAGVVNSGVLGGKLNLEVYQPPPQQILPTTYNPPTQTYLFGPAPSPVGQAAPLVVTPPSGGGTMTPPPPPPHFGVAPIQVAISTPPPNVAAPQQIVSTQPSFGLVAGFSGFAPNPVVPQVTTFKTALSTGYNVLTAT